MVRLGVASHAVFELVPLLVMPVAKSASFILHLTSEVVDLGVEAFPRGLSAHPN
jgi:hypothetical protein